MKTIVFSYRHGHGDHSVDTQEFELEDEATEKEISDEFVEWVWQRVGDNATWYEKEEE